MASSWILEQWGPLCTAWADRPAIDTGRLDPRERAWLDAIDALPQRKSDWIAGRLGLARLLPIGSHVLASQDGAPRVVGADWVASVSHEDGWVAVAARPASGRVSIDVVPDHAARAAGCALARVRVSGDTGEPTSSWAALECAVKLRGAGVGALLAGRFHLERLRATVRVDGLGAPVWVRLRRLPGAVLALADEP